jgi:hypothetical protein
MDVPFKALLLAFAFIPPASAQAFGDGSDKVAAESVRADCDTFAQITKGFLNSRGLKIAQSYTKADEDWSCGPGYRCIQFKNAPPRAADGRALSRSDVVKDYLKDPAKADFRWKNLTHGYWAAPNHNFVMGAKLQLQQEATGCTAKLHMGFGLGGTVFLVIIPYDLYTWPIPPDNGRLQNEYMEAVVKALPR